MFIGEVLGAVVTTRRTGSMDGLPLRIVRKVTAEAAEATETYAVAVDAIGASVGEYVLVTGGSAARQTTQTDARPVDAIIFAIVDTWQIDDRVIYDKAAMSAAGFTTEAQRSAEMRQKAGL